MNYKIRVNFQFQFILVINQLDAQIFLFYNKFISCLYMFRAHVLETRRSMKPSGPVQACNETAMLLLNILRHYVLFSSALMTHKEVFHRGRV